MQHETCGLVLQSPYKGPDAVCMHYVKLASRPRAAQPFHCRSTDQDFVHQSPHVQSVLVRRLHFAFARSIGEACPEMMEAHVETLLLHVVSCILRSSCLNKAKLRAPTLKGCTWVGAPQWYSKVFN